MKSTLGCRQREPGRAIRFLVTHYLLGRRVEQINESNTEAGASGSACFKERTELLISSPALATLEEESLCCCAGLEVRSYIQVGRRLGMLRCAHVCHWQIPDGLEVRISIKHC